MTNYTAGLASNLTTPSIGLPSLQPHQRLRFSYQEWFESESDYDYLIISASVDGGLTWTELGRKSGNSNAQWRYEYIDVTHFEGQVVEFRYTFQSDVSYTYLGWYVDQVRVELIDNAGMLKTSTGLNVDIISIDANSFPNVFVNLKVFDDQGAVIPNLNESNFLIYDNFLSTHCLEVFPPGNGQGSRLVDIVFVMDNSGSMSDEQLAVRNNVRNFIDSLSAQSVDYALGLTRYGQGANNGAPMAANGGILTTDSAYFKNTIWLQNTIDGGNEPGYESIIYSLNNFNWTAGARKIVIIITDETPLQGPVTLAQCIAACTAAEATVFALTIPGLFGTFTPLTTATGGAAFDILQPIDDILDSIAEILSGSYIISYCSPDSVAGCDDREFLYYANRHILIPSSTDTLFIPPLTGAHLYKIPGFTGPIITPDFLTLELSNTGVETTEDVMINVYVSDTCPPYVYTVNLFYRGEGNAPWNEINMTHLVNNLWTATIPASGTNVPRIRYYVSANDGVHETFYPYDDHLFLPQTIPIYSDTPNITFPPTILHTVVPTAPLNVPNTIFVDIMDSTTTVMDAILYYKKSSGVILYQNVDMVNTGGFTWSGIIPDSVMTAFGTSYYIFVQDSTGMWSTSGSSTNPHKINVPTNLPPVIEHVPIEATECNEDLAIYVSVFIEDTIVNSHIFYRVRDSTSFLNLPFTEESMVPLGGNVFEGMIPADSVTPAGLDYFIKFTNGLGQSSYHGDSTLAHQVTCPAVYDIGIMAVQQPFSPAPVGLNNIRVKLGNFGTGRVTIASISYTIDGGPLHSFIWTGLLDTWFPLNNVLIGSNNFSYGPHTIKVWTSLPNGVVDEDFSNDTSTISVFFCDPLNGTYTIDASLPTAGNNYNSIAEAINNLECAGVTGPVTINIAPGTYTGAIVLNRVVGASATNTITFKGPDATNYYPPSDSACGVFNSVTISFFGTSSVHYVLNLKKASFIRFENINFVNTSTSYPRVIALTDSCSNNHFEHCRFEGSSNSVNSELVWFSGTNSVDNHNLFINNCLLGNGYGFFLQSNSSAYETGNKFYGNFINVRGYGISTTHQEGFEAIGNLIFGHPTEGMYYGISLSNGRVNFKINRNRIFYKRSTGTLYGIYVNATNTRNESRGEITNNMVSVGYTALNTGSSYSLYVYNTDSTDIVNNSLLIENATNGRAAYLYFGNNNRFVNNIAATSESEPAIYLNRNNNTFIQFNYNNTYTPGPSPYIHSSTLHSRTSLNTAYGFESNGSNYFPEFLSNTDLHCNSVYINNSGTPMPALVPMDIDADMRDTLTPDMGADEFVPSGMDAEIIWLSPVGSTNGGSNNIQVRIHNNSVDTIHSVHISYTDFADTVSQTFTGMALASKDTVNLTFSTPYNFQFRKNVMAYINLVNGIIDDRQYNDTTGQEDLCQPLSGLYSINPSLPASNTNFQSFAAALDHLICSGISASVVFNVADGTYNEKISIPPIVGASSTSTITFRGASEDSSLVTMNLPGTSTDNYLI